MKVKKPRGTRDFPPDEIEDREYVEDSIEEVFRSHNYRRIQTPTFEHADLFQLKSGEEIAEHMYVFEDKSGRRLCLRPEATASVCRMYSEELRDSRLPLRLYYFCPMFRYERPQKGRYREFWHLGVELIGPKGPEADAEVISLAYDSLKKLGLEFTLEVGHIGILRGLMDDLGIEEKLQGRVIACIDKDDIEQLKEIVDEKAIFDLIGLKGMTGIIQKADELLRGHKKAREALSELKEVLGWLDYMNIEYALNLGIVRGLEYYTAVVFEVRVHGLGAQNQVCGGGRYDNLIELFSGLKIPAVGFAFGFDRVMNALELQEIKIPERRVDAVIAPVNASMREDALRIASSLRDGLIIDMDVMNRKLDKILQYAGDIHARYVLIVGSEDLKEEKATLRDLDTGKQEKIKITELKEKLREL
ncbi:MAG: histidine--tRNA ligase [Candidatus Altiarchaeota archaeon]|nr:histidine--tRNA ligase [Candidatus Altiarchaeota archaeon]